MEPEILLYIGGVADGERKRTTHHKVMVGKCTGTLRPTNGPFDDNFESCITQHLYEMQRLHGQSCEFAIMVWEKLTPDDMIELLISKYPAPKDDH